MRDRKVRCWMAAWYARAPVCCVFGGRRDDRGAWQSKTQTDYSDQRLSRFNTIAFKGQCFRISQSEHFVTSSLQHLELVEAQNLNRLRKPRLDSRVEGSPVGVLEVVLLGAGHDEELMAVSDDNQGDDL